MTYKIYKVPSYKDRNPKKPKSKIRKEYRELALQNYNKMCRQLALDHSDNGRCWWIYNHILLEYTHPVK
tara:strand:- start:16074 stop:16280 length:207 start_codon:yes stop_codon:yes gene_type:complete